MIKSSIVFLALIFGATAALADDHGVKVSGFVDAQYQFNHDTIEFGGGNTANEQSNTFEVNQGALYLEKKVGDSMVFVDIPFFSNASTTTNNFTLATGAMQAYIMHSYDFGLSWTLGQYDSAFRFEAVDSKDIIFANQGILSALILPVTHMGLRLNYAVAGVDLSLLFGNQNQAALHNETANENEIGFRAGWSNDMIKVGAGVLMNKFKGTSANNPPEDKDTETLIDIIVGLNFGAIMLDLEFSTLSNPNGESNVNATTDRDAITGILAQLSYMMDQHTFALRFETVSNADLSNDPELGGLAATGNDSKRSQIAVAYNNKINDHLTMKVEVSTNSADPSDTAGVDSESWLEGAVAGVFTF